MVGTGALAAGSLAALAAAIGALRRRGSGRGLLALALTAATVALACLVWALVTSDFRLSYVADTTSRSASWPVRAAGLWGGMAGSLLLWGWMLTVAAVVGRRAVARARPDLAPVATSVLAAVAGAFLAVSATVADPFAVLEVPAIDGGGLAPILQRPAMLYHPPLLYAGLVAMVVPFAVAVAAMARGAITRSPMDAAWLALVRRSAGVAWVVLTVGIAAGAHWAYGELGWGGFWAWDPIENAALLPWLAATALLHALIVDEHVLRRGDTPRAAPRLTTAALATLPFVLVVLGALLTRSGAVSSVHAFAEAEAVGRALLAILVVVTATTAWIVVRYWRRQPASPTWRWSTRRLVLAVNAALLLGAGLVVLTGTLYPLVFSDRSVAGTFFARFVGPLALAVAALVGIGPQFRWSGGIRPGARRSAPLAAFAGLATVVVLVAAGVRGWFAVTAFALVAGSAVFLVVDLVRQLRSGSRGRSARRASGAALAHLGVLLLIAGVAGSTLVTATTVVLREGESVAVAGTTVRHDGVIVEEVVGGRRVGVRVALLRGDREVAVLRPAQTVFDDLGLMRSDPALRSTPVEDVQVVLRRLDGDGSALLDVGVRPLVTWVWWGALVLAAGGALALTDGPTRPSSRQEIGRQATVFLPRTVVPSPDDGLVGSGDDRRDGLRWGQRRGVKPEPT